MHAFFRCPLCRIYIEEDEFQLITAKTGKHKFFLTDQELLSPKMSSRYNCHHVNASPLRLYSLLEVDMASQGEAIETGFDMRGAIAAMRKQKREDT
jgi:hypothetical protein